MTYLVHRNFESVHVVENPYITLVPSPPLTTTSRLPLFLRGSPRLSLTLGSLRWQEDSMSGCQHSVGDRPDEILSGLRGLYHGMLSDVRHI